MKIALKKYIVLLLLVSPFASIYAQINIGVKAPKGINLKKNEKPSSENTGQSTSSEQNKEGNMSKKERNEILTKHSEEDIRNITDSTKYPGYEEDIRKVDEVRAQYPYGGELSSSLNTSLIQMDLFDQHQKTLIDVKQKYATYFEVYKAKNNSSSQLELRYLDAGNKTENFKKNVSGNSYYTNPVPNIDKYIQKAMDAFQSSKKSGLDNENEIEGYLLNAKLNLAAIGVISGKSDPSYKENDKKVSDAQTKLVEMKKQAQEESVSGTLCPKDVYNGADNERFKQMTRDFWKKIFPDNKDEILAVYIVGESWNRKKGREWNKASSTYFDFDESYLEVRIITKKDDTVATIYAGDLRKNHLNNDKIDLQCTMMKGWQKVPIYVNKILIKNIKK